MLRSFHPPAASSHRRSRTIIAVVLPMVMLAVGCGSSRDDLGPPVVHYGHEECVVCRMIVTDDRFAAALILRDDRGRHHHHAFDDIGCVFDFEQREPEAEILRRYVRDVRSDDGVGWISADSASFVHSRAIRSPMAFGLAAFPTPADALAHRAEVAGDLIDLAEARRRFRQGTLHVSTFGVEPEAMERDMSLQRAIDFSVEDQLHLTLNSAQQLPPGEHPFELLASFTSNDGQTRPALGLRLEIEPWMPMMGHGSPSREHPIAVAEGRYRGRVHLTMAGHWVVHVIVHRDGNHPIRSTFHLEVQ